MNRHRSLALACVWQLACSTGGEASRAQRDAGPRDGAPSEPSPDAGACFATGSPACDRDASSPETDGQVPCTPCAAWPPDEGSDRAATGLSIEAPASVPPDGAFPVVVRAENRFWGKVTLRVGEMAEELALHHGAGSVGLRAPQQEGALVLSVGEGDGKVERMVQVVSRAQRALTGVLAASDLTWDATADVLLSGVTQVPSGATLTIQAGTRVRLEGGARLEVQGSVRAEGSAEAPISFAPAGELPWGELDFQQSSQGQLEHVTITGGGGDGARAFGHSNSQPMVRATQAELTIEHGIVADGPGKAFGTSEARVTLVDTLIAHVDTGGEFSRTLLSMTRTHTVEIPDADGVAADDDNDGIYLVSAHVDASGKEQPSLLRQVVFSAGEDDGIDHNDSVVELEGAVLRGFRHEGIATSGGHRIAIRDTIVSACEQGVELGYGDPSVTVERAYLHDNGVGLRVGDSYERAILGHIQVSDSVIARNGTDVRNHSNMLMGPVEGALEVRCSFVGTFTDAPACNKQGEPLDLCETASDTCACGAPVPLGCE